ncbi:RNA polymerase sigma factor [Paenibacillus alginolyticus]|uniref:RNA polymerase sigma factor n=1 Tax=Paenibacillus alginolyticus TaxID=59839 RepID=A0ABT4GQ57_9BACL|nr:RNA polymerase sigma factor [Paenibacillus alginolyticus]MCY9698322.1 RNA polymerase sigma factor [Paenibacillus alginolyticus]MEC0148903.1 RNA polymerase sigma factor [Paenibacillus alginolyticus]
MEQTIYRYCLHITHNQWDAEDLSQEVLFKVYKVVKSDPSRMISKAYLYRIASNAWKDKIKMDKRRIQTTDTAFNDTSFGSISSPVITTGLSHFVAHRCF